MSVFDYFIGTSQSKYVGIALFLTILTICIAILFTHTDVSIGNRIGFVAFFILLSIFPIALSLFELTCIVTGGKNTRYNLCNYYAWFITIIMVIYCFILILVVISSMFTYKKATDKITVTETFNKISAGDANTIAQNIMKENFESAPPAPSVSQSHEKKNTDKEKEKKEKKEKPVETIKTKPSPSPSKVLDTFDNSDKYMPFN